MRAIVLVVLNRSNGIGDPEQEQWREILQQQQLRRGVCRLLVLPACASLPLLVADWTGSSHRDQSTQTHKGWQCRPMTIVRPLSQRQPI